jgi:hypothetical protein
VADHITLADIAAEGRLLHVWCKECGHRAKLNAAKIDLPPSSPIPGIANRMWRSKCGARNTETSHPVNALMDPCSRGADGRWR